MREHDTLADGNGFFLAKQDPPENDRRLLEQQQIIQTSLDGFWVAKAQDGRILEANEAFCRMVGYSREELLSLRISDLESDEPPEEIAAHTKKVMETGRDRFHTRHRHKQGHLIDLDVSSSYSELNGGVFYAFARDITERKASERQLRQALEFTQGVINAIPDLLFEVDQVGTYLNVWARSPELLAAEKEVLLGKTVSDVMAPDAAEVALSAIREADQKGLSFGKVLRLDLPQGESWFELSVSKKPGSDMPGRFIVLSRDITERKRMEDDIGRREREFRSLAENMPDNVVRYDWQARAQYFNPAMKASLAPGFLPVLGKSPIETYPGNDGAASYQRAIEQAIATGTPVELEFQAHDPRGEIRDHLVRFVAEHDDNGKIVGALAIGQDITERKRAEEYEQFRSRTLELVSRGAPLPVILEGIVRGVEQLKPDMICSILLLDSQGKRFRKGIGPSLPDSYNAGLDGLEIGIGVGSCGTAAATGERVIAEDIMTHPYWAPYKEIAAGAGLAACWSEPIRASAGQVLGTFAAYHRHAHSPAPFDIALIEKSTHLVSIAIERRRAEEALRASEREFRTLAENLPDPLVRYDRMGHRTYVSPVLERAFAVTAESMIGVKARENNPTAMPMRETYVRALEHTLATGERTEFEMQMASPDGNMRTHLCFMVAERALDGQISGAIAVSRDITERKRAELEREAHAHSLECLERINKALQGTIDQEQMMRDVLDVVLAIFDCDRAFLVYPCDPDAAEFRVPMECTKPEYPGALALGRDVPMDKEASKMMRITLGAIGPVKFGPGTEYPLARYLPEQYGVKSQMQMALHPKQDQPWKFGIHQCSHAKVWTEDETALFQKIGERLTDALTGLLIYRNLQASEQKFRSLAENLPDFLVRYDHEGRRTYVNPVLERVFGVKAEQMIGKRLPETNPAGIVIIEPYQRALERTLATGERSEFEMQMTPPGEDLRTYLCFIAAERTADGRISGAIALSRDITERKRMESEIRRREREFRSLAENSPDPIFRYDRDCRRIYANPASSVMSGHPVESLIGATPDDGQLLAADDAARLTAGIRRVFDSREPGCVDTVSVDRDGRRREYQVLLVPEQDDHGKVESVLGLARDVTAIRDAERQMTEFIANLPGFAFTFRLSPDGHGSFPFASPGIQNLVGLKPEDVKDDMAPLLALAHPDDAPRILAAIDVSARTMMPYQQEARACLPGLPVRWTELRAVPQRQADDSVLWHGIMLDIDERKRAERQLRDLSAHLQTAREEEKIHLARELHDDLGGILLGLRIETHLLNGGLSGEQKRTPLFSRVESMVELLDEALNTTRRIITDLRPPALDDLGLLAALEWQAEQFHQHSGIECRVACAIREGNACADCKYYVYCLDKTLSITLFRILQESLNNVARHSGASGVEVDLRPREQEFVLAISDNGRGLPEGYVIASTSYGIRGMRERVELLGGRLELAEPPGGGLSVIARLPLSAVSRVEETDG